MKANIEYIAETLAEFFKDEPYKITLWLMTPNPMFGNIAPAYLMMLRGDKGIAKVAQYIKAAIEGELP